METSLFIVSLRSNPLLRHLHHKNTGKLDHYLEEKNYLERHGLRSRGSREEGHGSPDVQGDVDVPDNPSNNPLSMAISRRPSTNPRRLVLDYVRVPTPPRPTKRKERGRTPESTSTTVRIFFLSCCCVHPQNSCRETKLMMVRSRKGGPWLPQVQTQVPL
ncbi:hypothetical protein K438DRAFT_566571 [Mycena galopus ATCC 62051]|nr:hypothetical protein K438DRAFT_566571 [Mycena galopus ATCC 62051]